MLDGAHDCAALHCAVLCWLRQSLAWCAVLCYLQYAWSRRAVLYFCISLDQVEETAVTEGLQATALARLCKGPL